MDRDHDNGEFRPWRATGFGILVFFAGYCVISYFSIKVAQTSETKGAIENLMLALPIPAFFVCFFTLPKDPLITRFLLAVLATVFAFVLAIPLTLTLGVWFRMSIWEPGTPY